MQKSPKPHIVHNTPKPICTLALNSSQTCVIFLPRACDLAWSESARDVSEGDCMFLTYWAQAAWAHQHGCWERDEGRETEQYRYVCARGPVCVCSIVSMGKEEREMEEQRSGRKRRCSTCEYSSEGQVGSSCQEEDWESIVESEREEKECECNREQIQKHWVSRRMEFIDQETQLGERAAGLGKQPMLLLTDVMFWPHSSLSASSCFNDAPLCQWAIIRRSQMTTVY